MDWYNSSAKEILKFLLANDLDLNGRYMSEGEIHLGKSKNFEGDSPLYLIVVRNKEDSPFLIRTLIELGADPNIPDIYGETPLYEAVGYNLEIIEELLKCGADVNYQNGLIKDTALHRAAESWFDETVKLLLKYGARIDIKDVNGDTVLDVSDEDMKEFILDFDYCDM